MERVIHCETLSVDPAKCDNKVMQRIERVLANLAEEDITSNAQELIIRNAKELLLIRAYRQRKLERRTARIESRLSADEDNGGKK
jgi:hypothetical protein